MVCRPLRLPVTVLASREARSGGIGALFVLDPMVVVRRTTCLRSFVYLCTKRPCHWKAPPKTRHQGFPDAYFLLSKLWIEHHQMARQFGFAVP
jgi:hypothetical protein